MVLSYLERTFFYPSRRWVNVETDLKGASKLASLGNLTRGKWKGLLDSDFPQGRTIMRCQSSAIFENALRTNTKKKL